METKQSEHVRRGTIILEVAEEELVRLITDLVEVESSCYEYEGDGEGTYASQVNLAGLLHPDLHEAIQTIVTGDSELWQDSASGGLTLLPEVLNPLMDLVRNRVSPAL